MSNLAKLIDPFLNEGLASLHEMMYCVRSNGQVNREILTASE